MPTFFTIGVHVTPSLKPATLPSMRSKPDHGVSICRLSRNPSNYNFDESSPMASLNHITNVAIVGVSETMPSPALPANHRLINPHVGRGKQRQVHD